MKFIIENHFKKYAYQAVLADGSLVQRANTRKADDEAYFDPECVRRNVPHANCMGYRWAEKVSITAVPACADHNSSVDATLPCADPKTGLL